VPLSASSRDALMHLARRVIRARVCSGCEAVGPEFDAPADLELWQSAGSFVSLHEMDSHRLRGCVGRLDATVALWESVKQTAGSVLKDPRFANHPVLPLELPGLTLEISVISPLRPCLALEFDLLNDGIYVTFGERSGCFLPQVARETGWSREQLLERLCLEKLNLPGGIWRHGDAKFFSFPVEQIGPERFEMSETADERG
jgi:AmmeMemoRadiSam system protein A